MTDQVDPDDVTYVVEMSITDVEPFFNVADAAMNVLTKAQEEGSVDRHDPVMITLYESLLGLNNLNADDDDED